MTIPDLARARASALGVRGGWRALFLLPVVACGGAAFSAPSGDAGGTDAGASSGADANAGDDASAGDTGAGAADAGPSFCTLSGAQFELCSDFDTTTLIPPWEREVTGGTGASSKVDFAFGKASPASLLMTVTPNASPSGGTPVQDVLVKTGVKKQNAELQLDLDVERITFNADAASSVVVASIAQGTDYSVNLVLRPSSSGGGATTYQLAIVELSGTTPTPHNLKPVPALGAWAHVTMDLNLNALQSTVQVQVDANASEKVSLTPSPGALSASSVRSVAVGVTVTGSVTDYSARIDNVTYK